MTNGRRLSSNHAGILLTRRVYCALIVLAVWFWALPPFRGTVAQYANWEVRLTGNDTNGGFFVSGGGGTDWSQQDAAQYAVTDAVTAGTTTITSVTANFGTDVVNNGCYVAGGTGSIVAAWYQVISRTNSTTIVVDRSTGLSAGTGATLNCGGGLATLQTAVNAIKFDNQVIWVKAGTWTLTTTVTIQNAGTSSIAMQIVRGYNATHGDRTTRPLITTATNSTPLWTIPGTGSTTRVMFDNLSMSNTAATRAEGIIVTGNYGGLYVSDSVFDGFTVGVLADGGSIATSGQSLGFSLMSSEFKNCSLAAASAYYIGLQAYGCYVHDNTKDGFVTALSNTGMTVANTIFAKNGRYALNVTVGQNHYVVNNCSFYTNGTTFTGNPFEAIPNEPAGEKPALITNSIFYGGATGYVGSNFRIIGRNNAMDSAGFLPASYMTTGDVTLTVDPFVNAGAGNFALNNTAGGGALLRGTGYPGVFAGGTTTGTLDIGAVQTGSSAVVCASGFACKIRN